MASGRNTSFNTISGLITKELKLNGSGSYICYLSKNRTLLADFLLSQQEVQVVRSGSIAEGTNLTDSDFDQMFILPDITVHTVKTNPENIKGHSFLLDATDSSPGYAKLKLLKLKDMKRQVRNSFDISIQEMLQDTNNGMSLSSDSFVNFCCSGENVPSREVRRYCRHGPCATMKYPDLDGYLTGIPGMTIELDYVYALSCEEWPTEAREWISRKRYHNWPPKDVVDKISKQTCHVVPIGDKHSEFFSMEWRISFLLGERELVWNFNDTQVQCYVLLKCIFKQHLAPLAPDQLSSYHLKTIVFWKSEENGLSIWYDENLLQCMIECLSELKKSIEEKTLAHYFHRQINLLAHKLENPIEKACVLQKIDEIQKHIVTNVLNCIIVNNDLSDMRFRSCLDKFIEISRGISNLHEIYGKVQKYEDVFRLYKIMFGLFTDITINSKPSLLLRQLEALNKNPPDGVEFRFLKYTKLFLLIRLGFEIHKHLISPKDSLFQQIIENTTTTLVDPEVLIWHGRQIDFLSGALYLASIYICQSQFKKSNDLLLAVIRQDKNLMYPCESSDKRYIEMTCCGKFKLMSLPVCTECPAYDILLSSGDVDCVPYAVKFECILSQDAYFNCVTIHPCVYAYFLLCIGQYYSGNNMEFTDSLEELRSIVYDIGNGFNKYRAYNLLGYCYYLDNNLAEAVGYYGKSLKETRNMSNVVNAANYHLSFLLMQLSKEKEPKIMYEGKSSAFKGY